MYSIVVRRPVRALFCAATFLMVALAQGCAQSADSILGSLVNDGADANGNDGTSVATDDPGANNDDGADGSDHDGSVADGAGEDVPQNEYCAVTADWPEAHAAFEAEVLTLVNEHRAAGANCGQAGSFDSVPPLTMNSALRCAARVHSLDMSTRGYFDHTNPEGEGPRDRTTQAGYAGSSWGENIAWGYPTPESVVSGWMNSPGHCANVMRAGYTEIGVGFAAGNYWTQNFGTP